MSIASLNRMLDILEEIGFSKEGGGELSVSEISEALNIPPSTVHRVLKVLVSRGLVMRTPSTRKYGFTQRMSRLGASALLRPQLVESLARLVSELAANAEETASSVWVYGYDGLFGFEAPCARMLRAIHEVGSSVPLHCTAFGKAILAHYDPHMLETYINETGLPAYTRFTITNAYALREQLEEIRQQGFAVEKHEWELGAGSVAASIRDPSGNPLGAVGVTGPVVRLEEKGYETLGSQAVLAAHELSLGHGVRPSAPD